MNNAYVVDEMGEEDDACHANCVVSPVPAVEEEETRIPAMRRAPREPTKSEIDEHNLTHLPFRSWCLCCIAAKAKHWHHRRMRDAEGGEEEAPSTHTIYWFMRDDEVDENVTVNNYKEKSTKSFGTHVVKKG